MDKEVEFKKEDERIKEILKNKTYDLFTEEDLTKITKICSNCKIFKPLKEYDKNKSSKLNRKANCKMCVSEKYHKKYEENKKKNIKIIVNV